MLLKLQKNAKITLSILFIFIGIALLTFNYFGSVKSNLFNEKNIELLSQQIELPEEVRTIDEEEPDITSPVQPSTTGYIGYLSVPDVNIKRGFVDFDNPDNTLSKNIMLIKGSSMPDVKNGNLILAGHNGRSWYSFFNDLYKLKDGAHAYVTYNGRVYDYTLKNRYDVPKIGTITVQRNGDVNTLTLITCHRTDNHKQVVFIFELSNVTIA
jgi:LPXTG-site transpeptidase (sortase) family protein